MMEADPLVHRPIGPLGRGIRATLLIAASAELVAMIPCLGIFNWAVAPLCIVPLAMGIVGLLDERREEHEGPLLAGVFGGGALLALSAARLVLGGGVI